MSAHAPGFPEDEVRARARNGTARCSRPPRATAGRCSAPRPWSDDLDQARLVPPVFMPQRLGKLIDLGREPSYDDVDLSTAVGGFPSPLPLYLSAFGSTQVGSAELGIAAGTAGGPAGHPDGDRRERGAGARVPAGRRRRRRCWTGSHAYLTTVDDGHGGVVVQQSTEDADSEVWNLVYSDPRARRCSTSGRLAFELKVGQGAKPGLGGMTVLGREAAGGLARPVRACDDAFGADGSVLRCATPGTFTEEIVRQQVRFMRNNFPRARVWVKLPPGRDVGARRRDRLGRGRRRGDRRRRRGRHRLGAARVPATTSACRSPSACAGSARPRGCLLATGRMWEGSRVVRSASRSARPRSGSAAPRCWRSTRTPSRAGPAGGGLALETRLLISALGKYRPAALCADDLWWPDAPVGRPVPDRVDGLV